MIKLDFKPISLRGRTAYAILCFKAYVENKYANVDFTSVLNMMWNIVGSDGYIDENASRYMEIIPEYLYEFDNYEDAEFDYLSLEDFKDFINIIPNSDDDLNTIMHSIYDIPMEYAYSAVPDNISKTPNYVFKCIDILINNGISLPDISLVSSSQISQHGGWGEFINPIK